jgi:uncharacterized membrane protein
VDIGTEQFMGQNSLIRAQLNFASAAPLVTGVKVHPPILASFLILIFEFSSTPVLLCTAGIALFVIGIFAVKKDVDQASGLDKLVALSNVCFAIPLAVFGTEHFANAKSIMQLVPAFMPWRLFWTYFVGVALLAASLSIATKIQVRWSGLLFGIMMFLFVAMIDLRAALAQPHNRIFWVLLFRQMSFGGAAWILAGDSLAWRRSQGGNKLITVGRIVIGIAAVFYGCQHFLHPLNVPGVPLQKLMPMWIPAPQVIGYLTGAILLVSGVCILMAKETRTAAKYLGAWIVLLVLLVYGPILIASMSGSSTAVKIEGINYFFDTLLYGGAILALAKATPGLGPNKASEKRPVETSVVP